MTYEDAIRVAQAKTARLALLAQSAARRARAMR